MWETVGVRMTMLAAVSAVVAGMLTAPQASAEPQTCNDPFCVPGITPNVVQGSYCSNTSYYVFGTAVAGASTRAGCLLFCGSPPVRTAMVPVAADGRDPDRGQRLCQLSGLRGAGAGRPVSDLCPDERSAALAPRGCLSTAAVYQARMEHSAPRVPLSVLTTVPSTASSHLSVGACSSGDSPLWTRTIAQRAGSASRVSSTHGRSGAMSASAFGLKM